jgi:hypothetical protein
MAVSFVLTKEVEIITWWSFLDAQVQQGLSYLDAIAIAVLVLGGVLLIIGFLGCCGAMKQVKVFLTIVSQTSSFLSLIKFCF